MDSKNGKLPAWPYEDLNYIEGPIEELKPLGGADAVASAPPHKSPRLENTANGHEIYSSLHKDLHSLEEITRSVCTKLDSLNDAVQKARLAQVPCFLGSIDKHKIVVACCVATMCMGIALAVVSTLMWAESDRRLPKGTAVGTTKKYMAIPLGQGSRVYYDPRSNSVVINKDIE